jgi:hypothetical protein
MVNDYLDADPTKPNLKQGLIGALMGQGGIENSGINGWSAQQPQVELPKIEAGAPEAPAAPAAPTWNPGAKAGQKVTLLGFDSDKLEDPNSGSAAGSKYDAAAKTFYNGLKQDVGLSRGGLGNMVGYFKGNGFPDATAVGDDKIDPDGPGPKAPIDVIRSDGQIVFQNTTGNPQWEGQYGGGGGGGGGSASQAPQGGLGGGLAGLAPSLGGDANSAIQGALGKFGDAGDSSLIQRLIAQLQGGR